MKTQFRKFTTDYSFEHTASDALKDFAKGRNNGSRLIKLKNLEFDLFACKTVEKLLINHTEAV